MKVIRYNTHYIVRLTPIELGILQKSMVDPATLKDQFTTGERRSLARRIRGGQLFRVDEDRRTPEYRDELWHEHS